MEEYLLGISKGPLCCRKEKRGGIVRTFRQGETNKKKFKHQKKALIVCMYVRYMQCDQIGRICALWVIDYFGLIFENLKK
jgi:hypothetical protein